MVVVVVDYSTYQAISIKHFPHARKAEASALKCQAAHDEAGLRRRHTCVISVPLARGWAAAMVWLDHEGEALGHDLNLTFHAGLATTYW